MPPISAGLLMYRRRQGELEVLLAHPGGPFFKNKDDGAWTIPKGEVQADQELLNEAVREFREETGIEPTPPFTLLKPVTQKNRKVVHAWAFEGDCDAAAIVSNTFTIAWPPKSGRMTEFPEIDRADWFDVTTAKQKINPAQVAFIEELERTLGLS